MNNVICKKCKSSYTQFSDSETNTGDLLLFCGVDYHYIGFYEDDDKNIDCKNAEIDEDK